MKHATRHRATQLRFRRHAYSLQFTYYILQTTTHYNYYYYYELRDNEIDTKLTVYYMYRIWLYNAAHAWTIRCQSRQRGQNYLLLTWIVCVSYAKMQTVPARAACALEGPLPTRSRSQQASLATLFHGAKAT